MILDLANPAKPIEVGRWWIPGQWEAGGETYPWGAWVPPRCHHPLRVGDRLYVSYWHHGFFILDISDMSKPKLVSALNTSPVYPHPTHTCLVMPELLKGRKIMIVADEDVAKLWPAPPSFAWTYDITKEQMPIPISTFQVPGLDKDGNSAAADDWLSSAVRTLRRQHCAVRLVRAGPAYRRLRRSLRAKGDRLLRSGCRAWGRPRVVERRDHRQPGSDLSRRPRERRRYHRSGGAVLYKAGRGQSSEKRKGDIYPIGKKNPNLPFHPAVRAGDFIFVSGQVAKDANGNMLSGTIEEETAGRSNPSVAFWRRMVRRSPT